MPGAAEADAKPGARGDAMNTNERLTLSVPEAAAMLGISRNLGYELARRGELPGVIALGGKRLVVSRAVLEKVLKGGEDHG